MNATVEQLERVFKKFGPIKRDGIQVRSSKVSLLQAFLLFCFQNLLRLHPKLLYNALTFFPATGILFWFCGV